jgi:phage terminase large subunit GpA-like protein
VIDFKKLGLDWLGLQVEGLTERIEHISPSAFNEENRFLPESVTNLSGFMRYNINPFMREIVDCFDIDSPVREVNLKKGEQITYTTGVLEAGAFYYMAHIRSLPIMFVTAEKELATARIENNFLPMLNDSDFGHIIRSSDTGNSHKTGKTANMLQFEGGGYLFPTGAKNPNKGRQVSICIMLEDEIDAWPDIIGKDGDPVAIFDGRCKGYWDRRKIFRGSTPLILASSKIEVAYKKGDQRKYYVRCKKCGFPQVLRWDTKDGVGGFKWDYDEGGILNHESVRYCCQDCGEPHYEYDKSRLFASEHGAEWKPTAKPSDPFIRSYHLPALYSPIGMQPWYKCVGSYLDGYDPVSKRVVDVGKFQVFYNNILAEAFEIRGSKIMFQSVSAHRRSEYLMGQIPNKFAERWMGSPVLFLTCSIDLHKKFLSVSVYGWCVDSKCVLIESEWFEAKEDEPDCTDLSCSVWGRARALIEEKVYTADDGRQYRISVTMIDASYSTHTVVDFCGQYASGVYPIMGRDRPAKYQTIKEFAEFTTQSGTKGYRLLVDHYKDIMAPVLRREWSGETQQTKYHFNAPMDYPDNLVKELTAEIRRKQTDDRGVVTYVWHRPSNAHNHEWDKLGYGYASVDIIAWDLCVVAFKMETVDWVQFWTYQREQLLHNPTK